MKVMRGKEVIRTVHHDHHHQQVQMIVQQMQTISGSWSFFESFFLSLLVFFLFSFLFSSGIFFVFFFWLLFSRSFEALKRGKTKEMSSASKDDDELQVQSETDESTLTNA